MDSASNIAYRCLCSVRCFVFRLATLFYPKKNNNKKTKKTKTKSLPVNLHDHNLQSQEPREQWKEWAIPPSKYAYYLP